jgi:hypothetical protein
VAGLDASAGNRWIQPSRGIHAAEQADKEMTCLLMCAVYVLGLEWWKKKTTTQDDGIDRSIKQKKGPSTRKNNRHNQQQGDGRPALTSYELEAHLSTSKSKSKQPKHKQK